MLEIKNLKVKIGDKEIIHDLSFEIKAGKKYALLGPNGCGKSSLFGTITGLSKYSVLTGKILLENEDISKLPADERYKKGIVSIMQNPLQIKGVKLDTVASEITNFDNYWEFLNQARKINSEKFLDRELNKGLSGGEMKRSELLLASLNPNAKIYLFDEIDSGVDIENLPIIGKFANNLIKKSKASCIFITHTMEILKHVDIDEVIVMIDGEIRCTGKPKKILPMIKKNGFTKCIICKNK